MPITKKQVNSLNKSKEILLVKEKNKILLTTEWAKRFPSEAGVCVFFEGGKIVYVGETGSIAKRMKNLIYTREHTLRKKIALNYFSGLKGYEKGSNKYTVGIEAKINDFLINRIEFSYLLIDKDRKDLKKLVMKEYKPIYNS